MLYSRPNRGAPTRLLLSQPFKHSFPDQSTLVGVGKVFEASVTHVVDARVDDDEVWLEPHTVAAVSLEQLPGVVSVERKVDDINAAIRVSFPQKTPQVGVNRFVVHDPPAVSRGFPQKNDAKRAGRLRSTHHRTPIAHGVRCCEGAIAVSKHA